MSCCNNNQNCYHDPCGSSFDQLANQSAQYAQYSNLLWKEFNALYLGPSATAPTQDNDGNALQVGALYWNTTSSQLFVYNGTTWVSTSTYLVNGDKGDITVTNSGNTWTIDNATITTAKIVDLNVTTAKIADSSITSAKIVDGTIVNADVSASAAIAGTKIASNFGTQDVITTGEVVAGAGTVTNPGFAFSGDTNTGMWRPATDSLALVTQSGERMRVNSAGEVMIGTSTPVNAADGTSAVGITFYQNDSFHISNNDAPAVLIRRTIANGRAVAFYRTSTSPCGDISITTTTTSYNTSSDYRLKENIRPISNPFNKVKNLKPVTFNWKINGEETDGFVAHELQSVAPYAVSGTKDAVDENGNIIPQSIDPSKLIPILVSSIQELETRLSALEQNATQNTN